MRSQLLVDPRERPARTAGLSVLAVTNMYPTPEKPAWGVFVEQQVQGLRQLGVKVDVFYVDRRQYGMRSYYRMATPLREAVAHYNPSILHVMYGGVMASKVTSWRWPIPKIVTFHGSDLLGDNLSGFIRKWIGRYGVYCSGRAARNADGVVVVAGRLRQTLGSRVPESKIRVIPCGIDLSRFRPMDKWGCQEQLGWNDQHFHVLFPAHQKNAVKRPWLAEAAVQELRKTGSSVELHYLNGVTNAEVPVWINASDVVLLTSAHEGSPTVVKEALACNVPVVSVDVGDVAERIREIEGCFLAAPDATELAEKLTLVRQHKARIHGRNKMQELSIEASARTLSSFYVEILDAMRCCSASF